MRQQLPDRRTGSGGCRRARTAGSAARRVWRAKEDVGIAARDGMASGLKAQMPDEDGDGPSPADTDTDTDTERGGPHHRDGKRTQTRFRAVGANTRSAPALDHVSPLSTALSRRLDTMA